MKNVPLKTNIMNNLLDVYLRSLKAHLKYKKKEKRNKIQNSDILKDK